MNICIYGASSDQLEPVYFAAAEQLGRLIAESRSTLVFGGGQTGLMGACARGARSGSGEIIGISPRFFDKPGVLDKDCSRFIFTENMRERKQMMEEMSDAFILLPGGIGSYEEFFEIFTLRTLCRHQKPIAILNTCDYYSPLFALLQSTADKGFMKQNHLSLYRAFSSPAPLMDYVLSAGPQETLSEV